MHPIPRNGERLQFAFCITVAATILALISTLQAGFWVGHLGDTVPWRGLLRARLVEWYCYAFFFPLLYALALRLPVAGAGWERALAVHIGASFPVALAKEAIYVAIGNWVRPGVFNLLEILAEDYAREVLVFWALSGVAHAVAFQRSPAVEEQSLKAEEEGWHRFVVRDRGRYHLVPAEEVAWIEAQGNYACLNTARGRFMVRETMAAVEQRLASSTFVRVHRSRIVNAARVAGIERRPGGGHQIILDCGTRIVSGRAYNAVVRRLIAA